MQPTDIPIGFDRPKVEPLSATVGYYERHVLICTGHVGWPERIEQDGGFAEALSYAVAEQSRELARTVKITACDEPGHGPGHDLLVFPDAVRYLGVEECELGAFVQDHLAGGQLSDMMRHESIAGEHHVFVCCHRSRDPRCGFCGPALADLLQEEVARRDLSDRVRVHRTSHLGGHQFAANVIVYPAGDWFGYLVPADVPRLIDRYILRGELLPDRWRGRMGLTTEEQRAVAAQLGQ